MLTIEKTNGVLDKDPVGVAELEQKLKILKHEHADVLLYLGPIGMFVWHCGAGYGRGKEGRIEKIGMVTEPVGLERVERAPIPQIPRAPSRKS